MFETKMMQYMGNDDFIFFAGIVEDNKDPRQLGRLKVRVIGDHTQDKTKKIGIPTEELPWAMVMNPVTSSSMNGIGTSPTNIEHGTWVFGFYLDGQNKQVPVVMGTILGVPSEKPDGKIGFHDPDEKFPMEKFLDEPDTNRLARGELDDIREQYKDCEGKKLPKSLIEKKGTEKSPKPFLYPMNKEDDTEHPILKHKRSNLKCSLQLFDSVWHEPITQYNAKYPFNTVWEYHFDDGKHGHVEEWDSTPEYERYHRYHSSGTFLEIFNDKDHEDCGRKVEKIVGDSFELDLKNKHLYVAGDYRITVEGNRDEYIKGNWNMHLVGCMNWQIDGQCKTSEAEFEPGSGECKDSKPTVKPSEGSTGPAVKIDVIGDWDEDIIGNKMIDISEDNIVDIGKDKKLDVGGNMTVTVGGDLLNKAENIRNIACIELELKANTILMETCLLLQKVEDMEMVTGPCTSC